MQTRINFTGKKRIPKKSVKIIMADEAEANKPFRALINLTSLDFPGDASVIVEAYHRMMQSQRYDFGTVEHIIQPQDTSLGLMGLAETVKFRILVTNDSGDIIGSLERLSIDSKRNKNTLLPVVVAPLDNLVWKLQLDGEEPLLHLNERIEGVKNIAAFDPRFILSVYPSVVREIFYFLAVSEGIHFSSPNSDWQENWIKFASRIYTAPPEKSFSEAKEEIIEWIDGVVEAFSDTQSNEWRKNLMKGWTL